MVLTLYSSSCLSGDICPKKYTSGACSKLVTNHTAAGWCAMSGIKSSHSTKEAELLDENGRAELITASYLTHS